MALSDLYTSAYHTFDLKASSILVTGGAGFIGSNLVEYLLKHGAAHVRVLDNLSSGYRENVEEFLRYPNFEFIEGDIRELKDCQKAVHGMQYISHQAALGSVPRSLKDPITSNEVNISGYLNMLVAAKESESLKRFIYAASSSTYGDSQKLPKVEGQEGKPVSPYAVTKAVNEMYADVFSKVYGFHSIGLRYFNVFGPRQNPDNPYAAVIPLFCSAFLKGVSPIIFGDGETSRDFTFVENAVQANIRAFNQVELQKHEVFNVACGEQISLNQMVNALQDITCKAIKAEYTAERAGDIRHSMASLEKIKSQLGYLPSVNFAEGLKKTFSWYAGNKIGQ
jgi:UDP-N-acetylglucosamine 4-epimerase